MFEEYFFFCRFDTPLHECRTRWCYCVEPFSGSDGAGVGDPTAVTAAVAAAATSVVVVVVGIAAAAADTATANLYIRYIKHSCPCVYTRYVHIYGVNVRSVRVYVYAELKRVYRCVRVRVFSGYVCKCVFVCPSLCPRAPLYAYGFNSSEYIAYFCLCAPLPYYVRWISVYFYIVYTQIRFVNILLCFLSIFTKFYYTHAGMCVRVSVCAVVSMYTNHKYDTCTHNPHTDAQIQHTCIYWYICCTLWSGTILHTMSLKISTVCDTNITEKCLPIFRNEKCCRCYYCCCCSRLSLLFSSINWYRAIIAPDSDVFSMYLSRLYRLFSFTTRLLFSDTFFSLVVSFVREQNKLFHYYFIFFFIVLSVLRFSFKAPYSSFALTLISLSCWFLVCFAFVVLLCFVSCCCNFDFVACNVQGKMKLELVNVFKFRSNR